MKTKEEEDSESIKDSAARSFSAKAAAAGHRLGVGHCATDGRDIISVCVYSKPESKAVVVSPVLQMRNAEASEPAWGRMAVR